MNGQVCTANNITHFLPNEPDGKLRVIMGSEKLDQCHLYLHNFNLAGDKTGHSEMAITQGQDWNVLKEANLSVDHNRHLVYFLAHKISPLILSVCVASYGSYQECCVLTPEDLSYKFERSQPKLNLNPDVGFVCWLSNSHQLPECRFYSLQYPPDHADSSKHIHPFPTAVFAYRISIQAQLSLHSSIPTVQSTSPSSDFSSSANLNAAISNLPSSGQPSLYNSPSSIFNRKFFKYHSNISNKVHYAVLLWPTDPKWTVDGKKFPVIQHVYAGPSIQNVKDSWFSVAQHLKFVTQGYAVLIVDGRGSANRGSEFEGGIKHNLGSIEVDDQVEGLQVVAQQSNLLDLNRVVVFGWSYGGFMSLLLLASHPELYRAACAGGAVTDWTLYDTCYTERYMGLPLGEGEELYKRSGVLGRLDTLPDEAGRLLIVHGMVDENVHFRHTEKLINGLIGAGKPHQLLVFPNERHAVRNGAAIEYFHATMLSFFSKALA